MLYDKNGINDVVAKFAEYKNQLISIAGEGNVTSDASSDLGQASKHLSDAWSNPASGAPNGALEAFNGAAADWARSYDESGLQVLQKLSDGLVQALENATYADNKVSGMFSGHW